MLHEYAVACLPARLPPLARVACSIIITSNTTTASVSIASKNDTQELQVPPGEPVTLTLDDNYVPDEGIEDKGIIITSDTEIQVLLHWHDVLYDQFDDVYEVVYDE